MKEVVLIVNIILFDIGGMVVVRIEGNPILCKTDEVGELCISAPYSGTSYWGLQGITNNVFKVVPSHSDGRPIRDNTSFVRTGLLGFLGPVSHSLIFQLYKNCETLISKMFIIQIKIIYFCVI